MYWPVIHCPFCAGVIPNTLIKTPPVACPNCGRKLQASSRQLNTSSGIGAGIALGLCLVFGLRGITLIIGTVLLWVPCFFVWHFLFVRIVPPKFEAWAPRPGAGMPLGNKPMSLFDYEKYDPDSKASEAKDRHKSNEL